MSVDYMVEMGGEVDFGATGLTALLQNVRTILSTVAGTVPLDRSFGIDSSPVDGPIAIAQARMTAAVVKAVQTHEPRVVVLAVTYNSEHADGRLMPSVKVRLREGVIL